ncbi:MAG: hypothetical protein AB7G37_10810 [Solirubrobacteraceae bacterium]
MSIRQAVELIATHGTAQISESGLRGRARNGRLGIARINGRIYTNPLNLVAAGLLPVDALDTTAPDRRPEIDDAELHAWLNPNDTTPSTDAPVGGPTGEPGPFGDEFPTGGAIEDDARGRLEHLLDEASAVTTRDLEASDAPPRQRRERLPPTPVPSGIRTSALRRMRAVLLTIAAVALTAGAAVGAGSTDERTGPIAQLRDVALVDTERAFESSALVAGKRAAKRGDYDGALELAAVAGDRQALARWQRNAATVVLRRARTAVADGELRLARQHLRDLQARYGNPLPGRRQTVKASVDRAERTARQRAAARRARDNARVTPTPTDDGTTNASATPPATSSASATASGSSGGPSGASGGSSTSSSGDGPGEFF